MLAVGLATFDRAEALAVRDYCTLALILGGMAFLAFASYLAYKAPETRHR